MSHKRLLALRDHLVVQRASYKRNIVENGKFLKKSENKLLFQVHEKMVKELSAQISKVDKELEGILKSETKLAKQLELIISIKGVGKQTAMHMIAYTSTSSVKCYLSLSNAL